MWNRLFSRDNQNLRIMNKHIFLFAAALVVAVACGQKADQTLLTGKFGDNAPAQVHIQTAAVDTVLNISNGTFSFKVPVDVVSSGAVETEIGQVSFVPDGSKLTFDFTGETPKVVSSDKGSVTSRLNAFLDKARELAAAVRGATDDVQGESLYGQYLDYNVQTLKENKDNFLGLLALQNVYYDMEPQELLDAIGGMAPALQEQDFVKSVKTATEAVLKTGEGAMFVDFAIEEEPGKVTRLSDFVGKGKYMLVDFWASWCGPCKREMPFIKAAYDKFHGPQFDVLSIAVWDEVEDTKKAAPELGIVWNQIINGQHIPTDLYGIQGIPHLILFGPDGTILKRGLRGEAIAEELAKYIK